MNNAIDPEKEASVKASSNKDSLLLRSIEWNLKNRFMVIVMLIFLILLGLWVMPFRGTLFGLERSPIPVDAIPDIGENQQIVFTKWSGRSPQDIEDQITYPLTTVLQGIPGVKSIRSGSAFGFSSIYIIFEDDVDFYWSRSRILEKLNTIGNRLPSSVNPVLGPDATALGQVFWYTVEGEGWDLHELRSIQDWTIRYAIQSVEGVSEVASIGGFVREYQVDVNPDKLKEYGLSVQQIHHAIQNSNLDVGAKTLEVNGVEYVIRGLGLIRGLTDIEDVVVDEKENTPIRVKDVANVNIGPAIRRGMLDKAGVDVVGGVVVARFGENPLSVIAAVKEKIQELNLQLPEKEIDGGISKVQIIPFYDRTKLIYETLDTLKKALTDEVVLTVIVVLIMLSQIRVSFIVSSVLPIGVLFTFILMKFFKVDSNIMSLSGIVIAIGTMVDMGIIVTERVLEKMKTHHVGEKGPDSMPWKPVMDGMREVAPAILTAILTTVVSFLPIFALSGQEGKLFIPLAYTKTFALAASVVIALFILPLACLLFLSKRKSMRYQQCFFAILLIASMNLFFIHWFLGMVTVLLVSVKWVRTHLSAEGDGLLQAWTKKAILILGLGFLSWHWKPLGEGTWIIFNLLFVVILVFGLLRFFNSFKDGYDERLQWVLEKKKIFFVFLTFIVCIGLFLSQRVGRDFMPNFDEGSFLYMPSTMPHAGAGESLELLQTMDARIQAIPEVKQVIGKIGRVDSAIDPAPLSMIETVIEYHPEYSKDKRGKRRRNWRPHIQSPDDIYDEIVKVAEIPGINTAPKDYPISIRLTMLSTGIPAKMALKVQGPDLKSVEEAVSKFEGVLKKVPLVNPSTVIGIKVEGKPYLEIHPDAQKLARYGLKKSDFNRFLEIAVGGLPATMTVEGRETYAVRVRYDREKRDSIASIEELLVPTSDGNSILLSQVAEVTYRRGPMVIKSEETFLTYHVIFDKQEGSDVEVVNEARDFIETEIEAGKLTLPAGIQFRFAGNYENQVRSWKTMRLVLLISLCLVFLLLYFQFKSIPISLFIFSSIAIALSGGMGLLWLYNQAWFLDFPFIGDQLRHLFNVKDYDLTIAVWVGFLALFGIASDDGVVMATYLTQRFRDKQPKDVSEVRSWVSEAAKKRVLPCLMTTSTTLLALMPVLTSKGRGADVMVPMALPILGGMSFALITLFVVPALYAWYWEKKLMRKQSSLELIENKIQQGMGELVTKMKLRFNQGEKK